MTYTQKKSHQQDTSFSGRSIFSIKLALITLMLFLQACASIQQKAYEGNLSEVKKYIEEGGDINASRSEGSLGGYSCLLLNCAITGGHVNVVQYLLDQGADVNDTSTIERPLSRAVLMDNAQMVNLLIEHKVDVHLPVLANPQKSNALTILFGSYPSKHWDSRKPIAIALVNAGIDINYQDGYGLSALHYAITYHDTEGVKWLLKNGADMSLRSNNLSLYSKNMNALELARPHTTKDLIAFLEKAEQEINDWKSATDVNSLAAYEGYLETYPEGLYIEQASKKLIGLEAKLAAERLVVEKARQEEFLALKNQQPCSLNDENWVYLKGGCNNKKANGEGEAVTIDGLKFVGSFDKGLRVKGEIFHNNTLMFDGSIKQGKPHGKAVCIHEGRPESCEFYKGKRIDGVFIQRLDFAHQQKLLTEQQRKIEARLAQNEEKMNEMADSLKSGRGYTTQQSGSRNGVGNALLDKATDHAVEAIFNRLF